jgi:hypothetical protein
MKVKMFYVSVMTTGPVVTKPSHKWEDNIKVKGKVKKGKVVPLRSTEAHLGDRRYSSCSFLTWALEGGEWSASRPSRALRPCKEPPVPTVQEAGWAAEPVSTQRLEEKPSSFIGDLTPAVQSVARHYTDWALNENWIHPSTKMYETELLYTW